MVVAAAAAVGGGGLEGVESGVEEGVHVAHRVAGLLLVGGGGGRPEGRVAHTGGRGRGTGASGRGTLRALKLLEQVLEVVAAAGGLGGRSSCGRGPGPGVHDDVIQASDQVLQL